MRNTPFWWILITLMILLDLYFFQAIKLLTQSTAPRLRTIIYVAYWVLSIAAICVIILLPYIHFEKQAKFVRTTIFAMIVGLFLSKLMASLFFLIDDVRRVGQWLIMKIYSRSAQELTLATGENISRSTFLTWAGMVAGGGLFGTLVYGFSNKYKYTIKKQIVTYPNLPANFKGLKLVHISDIHSGSLTDKKAVLKGVQLIMAQKPDMILFTGDLVNNTADEMNDYMDVFSLLNAPMGVYSTLGNHDYGDYVKWDTEASKISNLNRMKEVHAELGWKLLMNEHIVFEKGDQKIALLGIENWSAKARFPKYGSLTKAYEGAAVYPFKILMSHDPSHWKGEVTEKFNDIDLMLSGHTHGMQFGVEIPGFKWSPVQYVYKEWNGLYENGAQKLYVNPGFGFIGYPGRVGFLPEITVIELA